MISVALRVVEQRHQRNDAGKLPRDEGAEVIMVHLMERPRNCEITTVVRPPERGV